MRGAVLFGPRDIRFVDREDPEIIEPTDAILRLSATCVCGSDLWPYRGTDPITQPTPMGHEYCGIVEQVGGEVHNIEPGQFAVGSFFASDNTCPICRAGYQSRCVQAVPMGTLRAQAPLLRIPLADGAVGLLAVLAAQQLSAERIILMSRHEDRQKLGLDFGATDIVPERGDEGVARIKAMTDGLGAHSVKPKTGEGG